MRISRGAARREAKLQDKFWADADGFLRQLTMMAGCDHPECVTGWSERAKTLMPSARALLKALEDADMIVYVGEDGQEMTSTQAWFNAAVGAR